MDDHPRLQHIDWYFNYTGHCRKQLSSIPSYQALWISALNADSVLRRLRSKGGMFVDAPKLSYLNHFPF